MSNNKREILTTRIRALLDRSDELFRNSRYQDGMMKFSDEDNEAIIREAQQLISELRRLQGETNGDAAFVNQTSREPSRNENF